MKSKRRKQLFIILITAAAVVLLLFLIHVLRKPEEPDTAKGVALLKEMEAKDISQIEARIHTLHGNNAASTDMSGNVSSGNDTSQDNTKASADSDPASRNYKQLFANSVIMGDSITEAITAYDFLTASSVIATIGVNMNTMEAHYDILKNLAPQNIFLSYGSNDIERVGDDLTEFKKEYQTIVRTVRSIQPDANIYVNSIFPVQEKKIQSDAHYADVERYNNILREICEEEHLTFLDNTDLVQSEYFEPDDYHFTAAFYPYWLNNMANAAGL